MGRRRAPYHEHRRLPPILRDSRGELSVAKNAYVATRSGWFNTRSSSLASGVPRCSGHRLLEPSPTGPGLHAFSTPDEAVAALAAVREGYREACAHTQGSRAVLPGRTSVPGSGRRRSVRRHGSSWPDTSSGIPSAATRGRCAPAGLGRRARRMVLRTRATTSSPTTRRPTRSARLRLRSACRRGVPGARGLRERGSSSTSVATEHGPAGRGACRPDLTINVAESTASRPRWPAGVYVDRFTAARPRPATRSCAPSSASTTCMPPSARTSARRGRPCRRGRPPGTRCARRWRSSAGPGHRAWPTPSDAGTDTRPHLGGETYRWSKRTEWLRCLGPPARTGASFEVAMDVERTPGDLGCCAHGWTVARPAHLRRPVSLPRLPAKSRGGFRWRRTEHPVYFSGWFSDRAALSEAGRPAVEQDTSFGDVPRSARACTSSARSRRRGDQAIRGSPRRAHAMDVARECRRRPRDGSLLALALGMRCFSRPWTYYR